MLSTILLPTDGSESTLPVLSTALDWVKRVNGKLVVLSVAGTLSYNPLAGDIPSIDWRAYEEEQRLRAQRILAQAKAMADAAGVPCDTVLEQSDDPAEKILLTAKTHSCDAIFMAAHRRPRLLRLLAGSQTQKVLAHASVPVMVFR